MKKRFTGIVLLILLIFTLPFARIHAEETGTATGKNLRILFTHDLHSALLPYKNCNAAGDITSTGGFARLQTLINENRTDNAILLDGGDFSMGSLFNCLFETDAPELNLMGMMGYDATTLGNHEFDYGPAGLAKDLTAAAENPEAPALLASNIQYGTDADSQALKTAMEKYGALSTQIISKNNIKIGVFGLLSADAQEVTSSEGVTFADCTKTAKACVKTLKEQGAEVIICLSHGGTNADASQSEDQILARAVEGIDVIISGHTHSILAEPINENGTLIVSAGPNGCNLGVLDIVIDSSGKVSKSEYALKATNIAVEENSIMSVAVNTYKEMVQTRYLDAYGIQFDDVILNSDITLETDESWYNYGNHRIADLIADAYRYAETNAGKTIDVSIVCAGLIRNTVYQGDNTASDMFNILSLGSGSDGQLGYSLVDFYLYGSELKTLCQVENAIYPLMNHIQMSFSGLRYTYNPYRLPLDRVLSVDVCDADGNWIPVEDGKLYHVCCSEYVASQTGSITDKTGGLITLTPRDAQGNAVDDAEKIKSTNTDGQQLKEWVSLVSYAASFEKDSAGKPVLPADYHTAKETKTAVQFTLANQFSNLSLYAWIMYGCILLILVLILCIVIHIRKKIRRRRNMEGSYNWKGKPKI